MDNESKSEVHSHIARDLDEGSVHFAVRALVAAKGPEFISVRAVAEATGISTARVEPHLRALVCRVAKYGLDSVL